MEMNALEDVSISNISKLSNFERSTIELACNIKKLDGPAAYCRCVENKKYELQR